MVKRLKGKVAIVTGAGSIGPGIGNGKATAIVFAREGARVMAVDLNPEAAEETKRLVDEEGGECAVFQADVSKSSDCQRMVDTCIQTFGKIDILHNNVGIGGIGGIGETSEEIWDRVMNVNLKSMFLTCKYSIPHMLKQGKGAIVNIGSLNATRASAYPQLSYSVSKAGVVALTRELSLEFAAKGIRVNAILPGPMKTPMVEFYNRNLYGGNIEEMWRQRDAISPTGRQGEGWDTAYAALFLVSDEAKYVNGVTLIVDGGLAGTHKGR